LHLPLDGGEAVCDGKKPLLRPAHRCRSYRCRDLREPPMTSADGIGITGYWLI
jgi:hypothetical protein